MKIQTWNFFENIHKEYLWERVEPFPFSFRGSGSGSGSGVSGIPCRICISGVVRLWGCCVLKIEIIWRNFSLIWYLKKVKTTYSRKIGLAFGSYFIHCSIQLLTLIGHVTAPDTDLFRDVLVLSRFKSGFIVPIPTLSMIMS